LTSTTEGRPSPRHAASRCINAAFPDVHGPTSSPGPRRHSASGRAVRTDRTGPPAPGHRLSGNAAPAAAAPVDHASAAGPRPGPCLAPAGRGSPWTTGVEGTAPTGRRGPDGVACRGSRDGSTGERRVRRFPPSARSTPRGRVSHLTIRMLDVAVRARARPRRLAGAAGSPRPPGGMRRKREPGGNPGLPRSGEWERPPSPRTGPVRAWEATASRCPPREDVPASPKTCPLPVCDPLVRGHPGDLAGGSAYIPGGRPCHAAQGRRASGLSPLRALVPSPGSQGFISRRRSP
jgi:hypothetical protein